MTTEQQKAFEAWWSDPAAPNNTRAIFVAGWEAALTNRSIVVDTIRVVARQAERHEMRERFIASAVKAFLAGEYEMARNYREFANEFYGKI